MDFLRIQWFSGRWWLHSYICTFLCHWSNISFRDSFGQWKVVASLLFFTLTVIDWFLSGKVLLMTGNSFTFTSVLYPGIDRTYRFSNRSSVGKWWRHLYICPLLFHWSRFVSFMTVVGVTYTSVLFSAIDETDRFSIRSANNKQWIISSSLPSIERIVSKFVRSMANSVFTCTFVLLSVIDQSGPFGIRTGVYFWRLFCRWKKRVV